MSDITPAPPKRRSHLMDPNNPVRATQTSMSLGQVQKWVMSVLAVTTILHMSAGLMLAAYFIDEGRQGARIGLVVIAGAFAVIAVAAGRAIHRARILSPWLLLGVIPPLVGAWLIFG
ncbi:hypothetical protein [Nocardioides sp.]|uniref:hypothetical protein n=1 Tax=Nocardioides sp. TaxID=35761 RepID=UPI003D0A31CE